MSTEDRETEAQAADVSRRRFLKQAGVAAAAVPLAGGLGGFLASPASAATLQASKNKEIVGRFLQESVNHRNFGIFDELVAADAVVTSSSPTMIRLCADEAGGKLQGRDAWRQLTTTVLSAFPDMKIDIESMVAEGDSVAVRFSGQGTLDADFMGLGAPGRTVPVSNFDIFTVREGMIASTYTVYDASSVLEALGVYPSSAAASALLWSK